MVQIVLNDEQAAILCGAGAIVPVVDRSGRDLGKLVPSQFCANEISERLDPDVALALRRMAEAKSGGTFYTTEEVLEHLQSSGQT